MYSYFEDKAFICQIKDSWFESNPVRNYKYFSDGMADKRMNNPRVNPHYTS